MSFLLIFVCWINFFILQYLFTFPIPFDAKCFLAKEAFFLRSTFLFWDIVVPRCPLPSVLLGFGSFPKQAFSGQRQFLCYLSLPAPPPLPPLWLRFSFAGSTSAEDIAVGLWQRTHHAGCCRGEAAAVCLCLAGVS